MDLKWFTCLCPAGNNGRCKHVVATVYFVIDLFRQGVKQIPDIHTCTDKIQIWHARKPLTKEPLLFSDINFVKHDPMKVSKKELCSSVKYHNPVPEFASTVSRSQVEELVRLYDSNGIKLPVLDTIRSNNFIPVLPQEQSTVHLQDKLFQYLATIDIDFMELIMSVNEKCFYDTMPKVNMTQ